MKIKKKPVDYAFESVNVLLMLLVLVCTLYPFWYVLVGSVSSVGHLIKNGFVLWPDGLNLDAYQQVFRNSLIPTAYRNTICITLAGTAISMVLTILGAYVLTIKKLPGRTAITFFFVFTMLFSGGLVPTYLVVSELELLDTLWALILPSAVSTYNLVLMRNFFQSVPDSLYEAASIEGETLVGYLLHILLPLSGAAIATIALFYAVGYWNDYFKSLIYIRDNTLWPMQTVLRQALQTAQFNTMMYDDSAQTLASETLKDAMIVVTVVPILCVYPFVQKYFVKGVMVGSLKG
ncbi:ABC transporter permease subunit [Beduinella massiliensis]|uniref:ABC transporter permease subunit n=1 Tax=Beduinella massiliensis TaxID=1852363 RepID=UPI000C85B30C